MRIKIGNTWHNSSDEWLAVQFTEEELECVKQLEPDTSNMSFIVGRTEDETCQDLVSWAREGR